MLVWFDGFEQWGDSTYLSRAYAQASAATVGSLPRVSPGTRNLTISGGTVLTTPSLGADDRYTVGFGLYISTVGTMKLRFFAGASEQCRLELESDGAGGARWKLIRGSTTIATSSSFSLNQWYHFELQVDVLTAAATYELRQDESAIMSGTGANLANTGSNNADAVGFDCGSSTVGRLDDWHILNSLDTDGAGLIDFIGDHVEVEVTPTSNGHQQDFTRSTGSSNVANIDEASNAASTADYNHSDTNGQEDYYGFSNLPTTGLGNLAGIKVSGSLAMAGVGSRVVTYRYYDGGTEHDLDEVAVAGTSVVEQPVFSSVNPSTSLAWTKSDVDAAEFGVEVTS